VIRYYLIVAIITGALAGGCSRLRPAPESPAPAPFAEDEFAARAAALQKTCELAAVYVGADDARAQALVTQARADALAAVRRAPDPYRGGVFARAYERLDDAAATLTGAGEYSPPLSASEARRLRAGLLLAAEELAPLGKPYYQRLKGEYERPRRRPVRWGPSPTPLAKPPRKTTRAGPLPAAGTAEPPPEAAAETVAPTPPRAGTAAAPPREETPAEGE